VDNCSRAHGAGFDGDEQVAVVEAIVPERRPGFPECDDFGVRRRITIGDGAVESSTYDLAFVNHDRANWNFAHFKSALGRAQRLLHPEFVGLGFS
jgi:hypothetical protein